MTFFCVEPGRLFTIPLNMVLLYAVGKHNILLGTGTSKENNLLTLHDVVETTTTTVFPGFENSKRKLNSPQCYSLFSCLFFFFRQNLFSLYAMSHIVVLSCLMNLNSLPQTYCLERHAKRQLQASKVHLFQAGHGTRVERVLIREGVKGR